MIAGSVLSPSSCASSVLITPASKILESVGVIKDGWNVWQRRDPGKARWEPEIRRYTDPNTHKTHYSRLRLIPQPSRGCRCLPAIRLSRTSTACSGPVLVRQCCFMTTHEGLLPPGAAWGLATGFRPVPTGCATRLPPCERPRATGERPSGAVVSRALIGDDGTGPGGRCRSSRLLDFRFVDASDRAAAEDAAVPVIRETRRLRGLVRNSPGCPPLMEVTSIGAIESLPTIEEREPGVSGHDENPRRRWQLGHRSAASSRTRSPRRASIRVRWNAH